MRSSGSAGLGGTLSSLHRILGFELLKQRILFRAFAFCSYSVQGPDADPIIRNDPNMFSLATLVGGEEFVVGTCGWRGWSSRRCSPSASKREAAGREGSH